MRSAMAGLLVAWVVAALVPLAIAAGATVVCIQAARKRSFRRLATLSAILILLSVILTAIATLTSWAWIDIILSMSGGVSAALVLLATLTVGTILLVRTRNEPRFVRALLSLYLTGVLVVPALMLAPIAGSLAISNSIDHWNRDRAQVLIAGAEGYRSTLGSYPGQPTELVPRFLAAEPAMIDINTVPERWLGVKVTTLSFIDCGDTTLLIVPSAVSGRGQRYDFGDHTWSWYDSLLDDPCWLGKGVD